MEIIAVIVIVYLLYLLLKWLFKTYMVAFNYYYQNLAGPLFLIISGIVVIFVLISFIRAYHEVLSRKMVKYRPLPDKAEPAYKSYFYDQGFKDYRSIIKRAWALAIVGTLKWGWDLFLKQLHAGVLAWIFLPLTLPLFLALVTGVLFSLVPFFLVSIIHTLILSLSLLCVWLAALFLNIVEFVSTLWRSLHYVCPHNDCYERVRLPVFICPACGAEHRKLVPGKYGVFKRKCRCGKKLPTSSLNGRKKLPMICSNKNCGRPLHNSIGSAPSFHFALLGEPSSGKTSYLYALLYDMLETSKIRWFEINNDKSKEIYKTFSNEYKAGIPPLKTVQKLPDSLILKSKAEVGEGLFYFYDPAGEFYLSDADTVSKGSYQRYLDGIFFVVDPFSLPPIRARCSQHDLEHAGASAGEHLTVYERLVNYLLSTYSDKILNKVPVSVIITKAEMIHNNPALSSPIFNYTEAELANWLKKNGLEPQITSFGVHFNPERVKYFAVSAFGRDPSESPGKPFTPRNVVKPYKWLLQHNSINLETGSIPSLKMKSEFMGNALGFATAVLFFFMGFSLLSNPIKSLTMKANNFELFSVNSRSLGNALNSILPYKTSANLIMEVNPDNEPFFDQVDVLLTVNEFSSYRVEGSLNINGDNQSSSDRFLIVGEGDSLVFDANLHAALEFIEGSDFAYRFKADIPLAPGCYTVSYIPAVFRLTSIIRASDSFRQKRKLYELKM